MCKRHLYFLNILPDALFQFQSSVSHLLCIAVLKTIPSWLLKNVHCYALTTTRTSLIHTYTYAHTYKLDNVFLFSGMTVLPPKNIQHQQHHTMLLTKLLLLLFIVSTMRLFHKYHYGNTWNTLRCTYKHIDTPYHGSLVERVSKILSRGNMLLKAG